MNYVIGILIGLLLVCIYAVINLMRKIDKVEDAYIEASNTNTTLYTALRDMAVEMDKIDERGAFKSDDEVGVIFNQLHDAVKSVNNIFIKKNDE